MLLSEIFGYLSDPHAMEDFMALFENGLWDEWDTDEIGMFGPDELAIAAKSAYFSALALERTIR